MRKTTYSKEMAKLNKSSPDTADSSKITFRRSMYQEELQSKPQISKNTEKYLLKRNKSTGNICHELY